MRRYAFYFAAALVAFGIGSLVVFQFYFKQTEQTIISQTVKVNSDLTKDNAEQEDANKNKIEINDTALKNLPCKNKNLLLVWNKIKDEIIYHSTEDFVERGIRDCSDLFNVEMVVDLNNDKQKEVIIHQIADCPASGNCTFWVFQKDKDDVKPILNANMIQSFVPRKTQTEGYSDLELRTWNTGFEYYVQLFKFNNGKYTAQKCWFETYYIHGKFLKKPIITFEKCGEYGYVN